MHLHGISGDYELVEFFESLKKLCVIICVTMVGLTAAISCVVARKIMKEW